MTTNPNTVNWGCFLVWFFGAFVAVVAAFAVFFGAMSGLGESMAIIPDLIASLIMTGCFGTVIGLTQWAILRRYLHRSWPWILATLIGFLIASPVLLSRSGGFGPYISLRASMIMATALGGALGVAQWLAIYRKVERSAWWIVISLVSWLLAGFVGMSLKTLSSQMGPILYWIGLFFAGTVLSVIGMKYLLKQTNSQAKLPAI